MENHPIESLMKTTMENLKEMVDVNKIVGDAVETPEGNIIIPVSRISFGFVAGGTETTEEDQENTQDAYSGKNPFGGGSGGGVSVQPIAFLVVGQGQVRLLPVDRNAMWDRLIDLAPQILNYFQNVPQSAHKDAEKPKKTY